MAGRKRDDLTADLFAVPTPTAPRDGALDVRAQVSALVGHCMKESPFDPSTRRHLIAAEMSRLTGREITKYMLDAYSSEGRQGFNLPFHLVPAFEVACQTTALTAFLAEVRGGRLLVGREVLAAELGKLEQIRDDANRKARELRKIMGEGE